MVLNGACYKCEWHHHRRKDKTLPNPHFSDYKKQRTKKLSCYFKSQGKITKVKTGLILQGFRSVVFPYEEFIFNIRLSIITCFSNIFTLPILLKVYIFHMIVTKSEFWLKNYAKTSYNAKDNPRLEQVKFFQIRAHSNVMVMTICVYFS